MRTTVMENETERVIQLARQGKRLDGRGFNEMRDFKIEVGKYLNAESSARVLLGNTEIVAGIKMGVDKPYPDSQDEGAISFGAELIPLAHSEYEAGPPTFDEIELARVVDRGIRESKAIDFTKLCIKEGESCWIAFFDFYPINSDGNLFDAGCIAALASFMTVKLPKLDENNKIIKHEYSGTIKLERLPVLTTFVKVAGRIMVDPIYVEEKAAEARFSVSTTEDGYMSAFQKGMGGSFTVEEINQMIDTAFTIGNEVRKKIQKFVN
jgi:exosome complex component RRP42